MSSLPRRLAGTRYQLKLMLEILKTYMSLRKSHFISCHSGLKQKKISDELIILEGWIEELNETLRNS